MRWENVKSTLSHEVYELWHKEDKLLTLTFHPSTNSARVETADQKRVLMIRKEGFRKNKTVLRTEYGIKLGQLSFENKEPVLEMNDERLICSIQNTDVISLIIYRESITEPLATCKLNIPDAKNFSLVPDKKRVLVNAHSSLVLALSWYLYLPVVKNKITEYAA